MKTARNAIAALIVAAPAFAAGTAEPRGFSLLTVLFLVFGAAIVVFQAVPALTLFGSMLRALFALARGEKGREGA